MRTLSRFGALTEVRHQSLSHLIMDLAFYLLKISVSGKIISHPLNLSGIVGNKCSSSQLNDLYLADPLNFYITSSSEFSLLFEMKVDYIFAVSKQLKHSHLKLLCPWWRKLVSSPW